MNIDKLMRSIHSEMRFNTSTYDKNRVFDYVFLCFFLGNDFLPHFPSLCIRTHGIQVLLDTYNNCFCNLKQSQYLINPQNKKIYWKNVHIFIKELAKNEHTLLLQEYKLREKFASFWNVE